MDHWQPPLWWGVRGVEVDVWEVHYVNNLLWRSNTGREEVDTYSKRDAAISGSHDLRVEYLSRQIYYLEFLFENFKRLCSDNEESIAPGS